MYPLAEGMFAPLNQWYVAAWSNEVTREPMERMLLDETVVMYRNPAGEPIAVAGKCLHRGYPLSKGLLIGDEIECGYHGLRFQPNGACSLIPSQNVIPKGCKIKAYPVAGRG
ncbi:Rieske 2Fe-2S domain-containing protein [Paraburkholderia sp. GAS348]|jgi:phenylpropionate dioxygenase-like ring-hydroxylating dioxygenase large terminal subunit|uniref:Rieske 2Fe-2S domain-containing protein n=1 Tax=Paraburkholderia sp. GAS348 TaxID=3035132 RepID=UPI003D20003C